ncbi:alpha-ketoglutarate-dependent dioxygenase AlkB [Euzebyella marina]|uniref:Alpha-ketoglutarate-dependent dioxygenase AlkB n=1 Tax=Euzebyella marina TaxID=1761453 RepID=A0A3G2L474_9FLAO|nr:alpha-ketoglutarate-dependent dioxygenase AlkB [Euzebyella marina]AYN67062.1 alpha-ketoglutarate-dependent dioxygenase AlkB [Euzebyella marina]
MHRIGPINGRLHLIDSEISYFPNFISHNEAWVVFEELLSQTRWQQDTIKVFGKEYLQPRLTSLYGNNGKPYSYSNLTMQPHSFTPLLIDLKKLVDIKCNTHFTTCLLNLYRNGKDSNGWHADNEKELGSRPIIASLSFGQERFFHLKHRKLVSERYKLLLEHGSLLIMSGDTQKNWLHQIPKTSRLVKERINLTFRVIQ